MPRRPFVGGNWKCNGTLASSKELAQHFKNNSILWKSSVEVVVCPIAPQLDTVSKIFRRSALSAGAQNLSKTDEGAFTGEITAGQLKSSMIHWSIVGHSERRTKYGDDDKSVAEKVSKAQDAGLSVILCVGESLTEREKGETDAVNKRMLDACLPSIKSWNKVVIAYEPVWAIGTGKVATPDQAQDAHAAIRKMLPTEVADSVRILYGGSVTPDNCKELIGKPDIDGFLVGGASLKPSFVDIIVACVPVKPKTKPTFIKVKEIEPEARGLALYGKVMKAPEEADADHKTVVVGDETGVVTLRVRGDGVKACEVGKTLRIQNVRVTMIKGHIQVLADKWSALKVEGEVGTVSEKNDISSVEYELR